MPHKGRKKLHRPNPVSARMTDRGQGTRPDGKDGISRIRAYVNTFKAESKRTREHSLRVESESMTGYVLQSIAITLDCRSDRRSTWFPIVRLLQRECNLVKSYPDVCQDEREPRSQFVCDYGDNESVLSPPVLTYTLSGPPVLLHQLLDILRCLPVRVVYGVHLNAPAVVMKGTGAGEDKIPSRPSKGSKGKASPMNLIGKDFTREDRVKPIVTEDTLESHYWQAYDTMYSAYYMVAPITVESDGPNQACYWLAYEDMYLAHHALVKVLPIAPYGHGSQGWVNGRSAE